MSTEPHGAVRVFVGGTSDRDDLLVADLLNEVRRSDADVHVTIADGSGPRHWRGQGAEIEWLPWVPESTFLATLAKSHVSFLPMKDNGRAAGQMVLAASLEAGVPVVAPPVAALTAYGTDFLTPMGESEILPVLLSAASATDDKRQELRRVWVARMSIESYIGQASGALRDLGWPGI